MQTIEIAGSQSAAVDVATPVLAQGRSPFHLPVFVFAQVINFPSPLRVGPFHEHFSEHKTWMGIVPLVLIAGFEEVIDAVLKQRVVVGNGLAIQVQDRDAEGLLLRRNRGIEAVELPLKVLGGDCRVCFYLPAILLNFTDGLEALLPIGGRVEKSQLNLPPFSQTFFPRAQGSTEARLKSLEFFVPSLFQALIG